MQLQDGWDMDALWERTDFVWTLTWLGHGCFVGTRMLDANTGKNTGKRKNLTIKHTRLCVDVNMVGTWMLCGSTDAGCKHWKNTGKRKNLTIKHTRMPPICKNTHDNALYVQETQENARENKARPPTIRVPLKGPMRVYGVSENWGTLGFLNGLL